MRASRRRESERPPLVLPGHRKINETLQTVNPRGRRPSTAASTMSGARKRATASSGSNVGLALSPRERLQSLPWIAQEFVQPAMGFVKGVDQDCAGVSAHRPSARVRIARALNNLTLAIRRGQRPRKGQRPRVRFCLHGLRQLDLDRRAADRYAINQVANVGLRGADQAQQGELRIGQSRWGGWITRARRAASNTNASFRTESQSFPTRAVPG
jgi:hypothetical protein